MEDLFVSFVDTNKHYSLQDKLDIVPKKETKIFLWENDYSYLGLYLASEKCVDVVIDVSVKGLDVEIYRLDSTLAFIGHAGWYANNRAGVMPKGPKVKVDDIVTLKNTAKVEGYKCFLVKVISDKAGNFTADVNVYINRKLYSNLKIFVTVCSLTMPKPQDYDFTVEYWHHPYNVAEYYKVEPWSNEHLEILKEHQTLYNQLGGKGVICSMLDEVWGGQTYSENSIRYPSMIKWIYSKGKWQFDYTNFDKWVDLNISIGLDDKFICYSMMPWGNKMRYYNKDKDKYINRTVPTAFRYKYKKAWTVFLNDFIKHLDSKGIFEKIYIGFDERNNMGMILDFLDTFSNKDGKKFKISASFNNYIGNRKCLDRIDSVSVGLDEIKAHEKEYALIAKERADNNKFTSLYTACEHFPNSFALSVPAESYLSIIYALSTGNKGFLRWAYDAWVKEPLEDTTHWSFQAGDCFLIYPNKQNKKPQLSFRLVKLDEAVRDANKLLYLAKKFNVNNEIAKILAKSHKNYCYKIEYDASWGVAIKKAKWADEKSKSEMVLDAKTIQQDIQKLAINCVKNSN